VAKYPQRIVCLTEETTETLYRLGLGELVVGISGYTVRPPEARKKPKVSSFISARFDRIDALRPDLVFAFSDLQADIVAELVRRGHQVMAFNQRSVAEILRTIRTIGAVVGYAPRADALAADLEHGLDRIRRHAASWTHRPRVFFEEWPDPLISGIQWVDEIVEIAGGTPLVPELRQAKLAKDRICDPGEVARRDPEVIIASWCGKPVRPSRILERPAWKETSAGRHGHVYEVKSTFILQPGPAALTDGLRQVHRILAGATGQREADARGTK
jgi:iron complex transport system substrate-binding protein